jgi:hypothetical protein
MPPAMASSVSREPGSVAKTVADISVSKRYCNEKGGSKGPPSTSMVIELLAVFQMPKSKPTPTGPMRMQPIENGATMPTPVLPMMPTTGEQRQTPQPKKEPTRMEAIRAAKARITRRSSLQKQREALKG